MIYELGMKVCFHQFLGQNHSWSIVGQNLARAMVAGGHEVHLSSTNGYQYFPEDLRPHVKSQLDSNYDLQLSYTAMHNFPRYLSHGNRNRFGIWNYETTILPPGFAKYHKFTDCFLPSSNFSRDIFARNGVPTDRMVVVPHGIDLTQFQTSNRIYPLKTSKKYKILANIAQPHVRKNLPGLFRAFGQAFTKQDDVCLVAKVVNKKPGAAFEVSFAEIFETFKKQYPQHAEVEVISNFIPDISELYRACDIVFSMTHAECFWLPGLEAFAAGKVVVVSNYGGQLDFMNSGNSLLVNGKIVRAPKNMQYWVASPYAEMFEPSIDEAASQLKYAVQHYDELVKSFLPSMQATAAQYTWNATRDQIVNLCT
jgi:glycosyltransferase involved in cell wall biosynthesis